jgi:non-lysosomal glucosylceramidase
MIRYRSKDAVRSGVPLGGIGAGKIELLPSGVFNALTLQNNWSHPSQGGDDYPGVLGFHLALSVKRADRPARAFLLQTAPVLNLPTARGVHYEGAYPRCRLDYDLPGADVDVSLEAFSPWIPGDAKNSALPGSFFTLKVRNRSRVSAEIGFLFVGRNISGEWCIGRRNRVVDEKGALHLDFANSDPSSRDVRQGALRFSLLKEGWSPSYMESWNGVTQNFSFNARNISLDAWDIFAKGHALPNTRPGFVVRGENWELCGAVAAHRLLSPGRDAACTFGLFWHFPKHPFGHRYAQWFRGASDVSRYALPRKAAFERVQRDVESAVRSLPFPEWFNDALQANLSPFSASSWFVKDGRFSFYEAPVVCPLMGTLDVGFYGSIPLSYFFPDLEKSLLTQFAKAQRPDGYVPHDLGKNRLDLPSNGTTFHLWKDLNPKFILMAYRDYLWSGDRAFLRAMLPHVKRALAWSLSTDRDGNGLPDNEGADQTFDLWGFYGTNAYTSSIFLAALLAGEKMGRALGDAAFARECRERFSKGSRSFEKELWNGRFYGDYCALSQLNGQWYADLLGLGLIAERAHVKKALATTLRMNSSHSRFGLVNSVHADGRLDESNDHSKNIWSGMNYAFASLCISQGFPVAKVLGPIEKLWRNIERNQKNPWNQPDTIDSTNGKYVFGDSYYRNMAIWSIPIVFSARSRKTASVLKWLRQAGRRLPRA